MRYRRCAERDFGFKTRAFTLIEILVCLGIFGILLSLLLLGLSAARESSRKLQCQNNMRQCIAALIQAADRDGKIPGLRSTLVEKEPPGEGTVACNALVAMVQEMNISFVVRGNALRFDGSTSGEALPPPVLTCPSTGDRKLSTRLNLGVEPVLKLHEPMERFMFARRELRSMADITDGLSNTAALAERPQSTGDRSLRRAIALDEGAASFEEMSDSCSVSFSGGRIHQSGSSLEWWQLNQYDSLYDHTRPPNFSQVDCVSVNVARSPAELTIRFTVGTRSFHTGGSNSAFLDGSVHFVNDHIDPQTWRALGTHAGSDLVGDW